MPSSSISAIRSGAPDGTLDRAALGRHVFADPAALRELERIVHPLVRPRILAAIEAARASGAPIVVIEAIKLVEAGYATSCDEVWLVTCAEDEQVARLAGGLALADARQRVRACRMTARLGSRTAVIDTGGTPEEALRERVERASLGEGTASNRRQTEILVERPFEMPRSMLQLT